MSGGAAPQEPAYVVDESLSKECRYTESLGESEKGTYRECCLWIPGGEKPVSQLKLYEFKQRFGGVSVQAEGLGDVSTDPSQRRKGYITSLMRKALSGARDRVDAAYLFGISGLYGKFGFAACLYNPRFTVWQKDAENLVCPDSLVPDVAGKDDVPALVALFNNEHRNRPWTRVREVDVSRRLFFHRSWHPGPDPVVLREGPVIRAYALIRGHLYGWGRDPFSVMEAVADSSDSAVALLSVLRDRAVERGVDTLELDEPADSTFGRTIRLIGGEYRRRYSADGGGMGAILNRKPLIDALAPELRRRAAGVKASEGAYPALSSGALIHDPKILIRLLTGYWSWEDAVYAGETAPEEHAEVLSAWFPGGGTQFLPEPIAYGLDG